MVFYEACYQRKKTVINPIINWEDADVWEFIRKFDVPYCKLYDQGYSRLGCIGCPIGAWAADELARYPKYRDAYLRAFSKMIESRLGGGKQTKWKSAEDVMSWWLSDRAKNDDPIEGQIELEL